VDERQRVHGAADSAQRVLQIRFPLLGLPEVRV
jgi:hypothetical protein